MSLVLAFAVTLLLLGYACAKSTTPWHGDPLALGAACAVLALAFLLLAGRIGGAQRVWSAVFSLLGAGALVAVVWIFAALMMAFACDNARPGPELDAAFRVLYAWRYVAPLLVCLLAIAVYAGQDGVPARAWLVLAGSIVLWFGTALFWLVAGLRASP